MKSTMTKKVKPGGVSKPQQDQDAKEAPSLDRRTLDAFAVGVVRWVWRDGESQAVLDYANPAWLKLAGLDASALGQRHRPVELIHPDDRPVYERIVGKRNHSDEPVSWTLRFLRPDGSVVWVRNNVSGFRLGEVTYRTATLEDVTAEYEAQQQSWENASRLSFSLETAELGSIVSAHPGAPAVWNERMFEMVGIPLGERSNPMPSSAYLDRVLSADVPGVHAAFDALLKTGKTEHEHRFVRDDGSLVFVHFKARVKLNPKKKPGQMQVVVLDVTARKQLEATNANLRALLDSSPDFIGYADLNQQGQFINRAGLRMLGYPPSVDVSALSLGTMYPRETAQRLARDALPVVLSGQDWRAEVDLKTAHGQRMPVELMQFSFKDAFTGEPKLAAVMRDITERKMHEDVVRAAQEVLSVSSALQHALLKAIADGVYGIGLDGRCNFVNPAALAMFGYTEAEVLRQGNHDLFHHHRADGQPYPAEQCPIYQTLQDGQPRRVEEYFWKKGGQAGFPVALSVSPYHQDGKIAGVVVAFTDITERKRMEAANANLRALLDHSPDFIGFADQQQQVHYVNQGGLALAGFATDFDVRQLAIRDFHSDSGMQRLAQTAIPEVMAGRVWQGECELLDRQGQAVAVDLQLFGLHDALTGEPLLAAVMRDIRARKQAEQRLFEQDSLIRNVGKKFVIFKHNLAGELSLVTEGVVGVFGLRVDQVLGQPWSEAVHWLPGEMERVTGYLVAMLENDSHDLQQHEMRFIHPDGGQRTILVSERISRDPDGRPVGFEGVVEDITERVELERQRLMLEALSNDALDFVGIANLEGRSLYLNAAGMRMAGIAEGAETNGKSILDFFAPAMQRQLELEVLPALRLGGVWAGEMRLLHQDGYEVDVSVHARMHQDGAGQPSFMSAVMRDISDRKIQERALREATVAADAANKAKSEFVASVSHELRTPLNAILGMLSTLKERVTGELDQILVKTAHQGAEILLVQVNDILDFFKLADGKLKLFATPIQLGAKFQSAFDLLQTSAHDKGLKLVFDTAACENKMVRCDRQRLLQILFNLLSNAIKFTDAPGQVNLRTHCRPTDDGYLELTIVVQDTGIGMSADFLPYIFERFSQAQSSRHSGRRGSGLGLAITKQLVDLFGGEIAVESQLGKGSTFTVTLPLQLVGDEEASDDDYRVDDTTGVVDLRGMRVLYAEDNAANRLVVQTLLLDSGVVLELAENGQEAVERVVGRDEHFDLILMDMEMPVLNGLQATEAIRAHYWAEQLPIVALSANVLDEHRASAFAAGMNGFLGKPVKKQDLLAMLVPFALVSGAGSPGLPSAMRSAVVNTLAEVMTEGVGLGSSAAAEALHASAQRAAGRKLRLINLQAMEEYLGSPELVQTVLVIFPDDVDEMAVKLQDAMASQDLSRIRTEFHALQGVLSNFHAEPALALLQKVHAWARQNDLARVQAGVPSLLNILAETTAELRAYLAARPRI
jgi:PAS domain S-box-containing protein